jgi:hypothetical protein
MKQEFIIFKEGVTQNPVTILSHPNTPFDRAKKISFYKSLGYTVTTWS